MPTVFVAVEVAAEAAEPVGNAADDVLAPLTVEPAAEAVERVSEVAEAVAERV